MAKAGGMGDVVGALPRYINKKEDVGACVIIPKYHNQWVLSQEWANLHEEDYSLGHRNLKYYVDKLVGLDLGYDLYAINIPGLYDRPGVYTDKHGYGYQDELTRNVLFQRAALQWINSWDHELLDDAIFHCHDHHTGLIPFMCRFGAEYGNLREIPTLYTIHNGRYQGAFSWESRYLLPQYDDRHSGLLEWAGNINPMASAIKCSWWVNTVSAGYLSELMYEADGMESLLSAESDKSSGILNGIDTLTWDPSNDKLLDVHYEEDDLENFKKESKALMCEMADLNPDKPLVVFIGRLTQEKGAELMPELLRKLDYSDEFSIILLGTGEKSIEHDLAKSMIGAKNCRVFLKYDEKLAHQLYAAMDFLLMPSRLEPCGLNQMFAMRYGGIPIVRKTGGLADSVRDIGDKGGYGITFMDLTVDEMIYTMDRALRLYKERKRFEEVRQTCFELDFSWEHSTEQYIQLYNKLRNVKSYD